jgi:molybdopterin converting factor small subunit
MNHLPKSLTITYYAILREQRGLSEETFESSAATPGELYDMLRAVHGFSLDAHQLKVVINDAFQPWDTPLSPGDQVVFIPPVAGG